MDIRSLFTLDIDSLSDLVLSRVCNGTSTESAAIYLPGSDPGELYLERQRASPSQGSFPWRIRLSEFGPTASAIQGKNAGTAMYATWVSVDGKPRHIVLASMEHATGPIGALCAASARDINTPETVQALLKIAGDVTLPLYQALFRESASEKSRMLARLHQASQSLLCLREDSDELRRTIAEQAQNVLDADITVLYTCNERQDEVQVPPTVSGTLYAPTVLDVRGPRHRASLAMKILGSAATHYAPLAHEDWVALSEHDTASSSTFTEREGIVSSVGIPLRAGNEILGVLFINYRRFHAFTIDRRESIGLFARLAALSLQNAANYRRQHRSVERLNVLNTLGRRINLATNSGIEAMLPIVHECTGKLMDASNFYVAIYDEKNDTVDYPFAVERGLRAAPDHPAYHKHKGGCGITEYVMSSREPLLIRRDVGAWFEEHRVDSRDDPFRSWLGVPLVIEEHVMGMIGLQSFEREDAYGNDEMDLLTTIAAHVAPVLRRLQILQETTKNQHELELLGESMLVIGAGESLGERLDKIVGNACRLFVTGGGKVYLLDPSRDRLILKAVAGLTSDRLQPGEEIYPGEGLSGQVFQRNEPEFTNDYASYPHRIEDQSNHFRALLSVPLRLGENNECIGVLTLFDSVGHRRFTHDDIPRLERFASYAALAIRDARRQEQLKRQNERLRATNELMQAIGSSEKPERYFRRVVDAIQQHLHSDQCTLFLREEREGVAQLVQGAVAPDEQRAEGLVRFKLNEGLAGQVFLEGGARICPDATKEPEFLQMPDKPYPYRAMLLATLKVGDKKLGLLVANAARRNAFEQADLEWVETLASSVATQIENVRAAEILQSLSTQLLGAMVSRNQHYEAGLRSLLQEIVARAIELLQASSAIIYVFSKDKRAIEARYTLPGNEDQHPAPRQDDRGHFSGFTGLILKDKRHIVIDDVNNDPRVKPEIRENFTSMAVFCLKIGEDVIGALYVNHQTRRTLTALEVRFMLMLADLAALAIAGFQLVSRNARMRDAARRVAEQTLNQDWNQTLRSLLDAAITALQGDAITLFVYDAASGKFEYPPYMKGVRFEEKVYRSIETLKTNPTHHRILVHPSALHVASDAANDPILAGSFTQREEIKSAAAVRLEVEESNERLVVGVMFINYRSPKLLFSPQDREDIVLFASLAAATIRSAQRFKKLNHIRKTARQFANDNLKVEEDLEKKLQAIAKGIKETLGCDMVSVHRFIEKEQRFLEPCALAGEIETPPEPTAPSQRSPMVLDDVLSWDRLGTTDEAGLQKMLLGPFARRQHLRAVAALPLGDAREKVGVLFVSYRRPHRFSEEEKKDIQLFADQSAIAIRNAMLYDRVQREKERYETLLENSPDPIMAVDGKGKITYCNSHVEQILGYTPEQLRDRPVRELYWDGVEEAKYVQQRLDQDKTFHRFETFVRDKNGDRIPMLLSATLLPGGESSQNGGSSLGILEDQRVMALRGRMRRFFELVSDIHEREELGEILNDLIVKAIGLFSSVEAGAIFLLEDKMLRMAAELDAPEVLRETPLLSIETGLIGSVALSRETLFLENFPPLKSEVIPFSHRSRSAIAMPLIRHTRCLGVLYLESKIHNAFNRNDDLLNLLAAQAAVAIERARFQEIQNEWSRQRDQMFASSKSIVAAQISSSYLHEVKNLLHAIQQNMLALRGQIDKEKGIKKKKPYQDRLDAIKRSVGSAARLSNESQRFKENLTAHYRPEHLNSIVRQTLSQIDHVLISKKLTFDTHLDAALDEPQAGAGHPVEMDRDLIGMVVINLVMNAVEASHNRGKLVVKTHFSAHEATISITDFGKGIAEIDRQAIFEPFVTRRNGGVGLGLFISKVIVAELHGGYIDAESKSGKTTFMVHLPLTQDRS